ncbi:MAG: SMP-30/gluconolactonase/LRE family protein [Chloroflexota bacterium]|nr:SMP-30/gluconolactonase/LRE family protein [Chloroflexota bacterium]
MWNPFDKHLYWLDIPSGMIYRYDPALEQHEPYFHGDVTGGFCLQADGSLLLFGAGGRISRLRDGQLSILIKSLPGEDRNRFNDVIVDSRGRVLCGTMPYVEGSLSGSLYCLEVDGSIRKLREGILLSNGLGFNDDCTTLYYADSLARTITRFRYDTVTGTISHASLFASLAMEDGVPDGLTVDAEGCVWLAVWDGARLIRYRPTGEIEREVAFPVKQVSSLTFGGNDLADIYVTTAGGDNPQENGTHAGAVFRLRPGIRGKADFLSRVTL